MNLENLLKTRQLERHETNAEQVARLLKSINRDLEDARQTTISAETRLQAGYQAIMGLGTLALWVNGYRPSASMGHHATVIQSLSLNGWLSTGLIWFRE